MQWIQTDKVLFFRFWKQDFLKLIYFYVKIQQLHLLLPHLTLLNLLYRGTFNTSFSFSVKIVAFGKIFFKNPSQFQYIELVSRWQRVWQFVKQTLIPFKYRCFKPFFLKLAHLYWLWKRRQEMLKVYRRIDRQTGKNYLFIPNVIFNNSPS